MPWRNESELKQDNKSYEHRYKEVEDDIACNLNKYESLDVDYEELGNFSIVHSDEKEEDNTEFSMINPDFLDLEVSDGVSNGPVASVTVDNL